jgi:hypothetical protein
LEALSGRDLTEVELELVEKRREAKQKQLLPETEEEDKTKADGNKDVEATAKPEDAAATTEDETKAKDNDGNKDVEVTAKPEDAAATTDVVMADGAAIHENVGCNSCSTCPIVGIRYKCARCVHFHVLLGYN